jgi:hypothetical protein
MENKGYLGSIIKYRPLGFGSNADVYLCDYNDSIYAYKEFWDPRYVEAIRERIVKLSEFYGDKRFAFPYKFIFDKPNDINFKGYIMDELYNYEKLEDLNLDVKDKLRLLNRTRELLEVFHKDYKHLNCDVAPWNILYNEKQDNLVMSDFDTCIKIGDVNLCERCHSDVSRLYAKTNGVDVGLDLFLFNLCTYAIINNVDFNCVLERIKANDFGLFEGKAKEIFMSYKNFEVPKTIKKEYVIDYL